MQNVSCLREHSFCQYKEQEHWEDELPTQNDENLRTTEKQNNTTGRHIMRI